MKTVKVSGKTMEEAIEEACRQLEAESEENIRYKVLEEPSKGFLGLIGNKPALLEASLKPDPIEEALHYLERIIEEMKVKVDIGVKRSGKETVFSLTGKDIGVMIGKRGKTLDSLQHLVNLVANRYAERYHTIVLDAENYRARRREVLEQLANRLAQKAQQIGEKVVLEPMNSRERKIIHAALQHKQGVETYSEGTGSRRHVIIKPTE